MSEGVESDEPEAAPERKFGLSWFWILMVFGMVLLALLLTPAGGILLGLTGVFIGFRGIKHEEAELRKPAVYEPAAKALALYCQSDQSLLPKPLSYAWLPAGLARLGPSYCMVDTNFAMVEMGGGFYHFGYRLTLDESNSARSPSFQMVQRPPACATNVWRLALYREGSHQDEHLTTVALAGTQHLAVDDLLKVALSGFEESLKAGDSDAYRGKVMLLLRFAKASDAAQTCREWIQREPASWVARFTYAHVRCRLGESEPAAADFSGWVQSRPNFAHCIYLALIQFREGRTNQAVTAVRLALAQPFIEPDGTEGNKFYLGQNGALIAYLNGDYELCLAMCDKMLSDSRQEQAWIRKILRIKAAVTLLKGGQGAALELARQAASSRERQTFGEESEAKADQALHEAIQKGDLEFVRNFTNWIDEGDSWFSPFQTDETGIHGAQSVPNPYPSSWKSDRMNPKADD